MARNSQIWTAESRILLNGPSASREEIGKASEAVAEGGAFRYRFQFPPMRVGQYEVYWQRPLMTYREPGAPESTLLTDGPEGYLTAYPADRPDLSAPVELWPRTLRREAYLAALRNFEHLEEHFRHQTALNIIRLLDLSSSLGGRPVSRSVARQVIRIPERESLESWLATLPEKARDPHEARALRDEIERRLEREDRLVYGSLPGIPQEPSLPPPLTYPYTAKRDFEKAWWRDIVTLSTGAYVNKNNGDCVDDPATRARLSHRRRDLEPLGDYLLKRHRRAIADSGMEGRAICGELRFRWDTDFNFEALGGWRKNQQERAHERDLMVAIPGRNRAEAVIMADHYDTAYMEDVWDKSRGGDGAHIAAAGADDNCSAAATLLQACPVFLMMSKQGLLERDVWLVHLTGEEFPADCLGSRALCQALIERTLRIRVGPRKTIDLSATRVVAAYILDMIGHNRDSQRDVFQIAPGEGRQSLWLARQAHLANALWNAAAEQWNRAPGRHGKGRGRRSLGLPIPKLAEHPRLKGEIRLIEDPHSSLYNTDGQVLSDCGVPVVLLMEDYDITRSGYHDTKDTITNIDLDYGSALAAIAIEAVARTAAE